MRRARVEISIEGTDVSMDISPHLLTLTYTDKADDELDDFQFSLEDRERLWQGDWLPKQGDIVTAKIIAEKFRSDDVEELDCGEFEVEEVTLDTSFDSGDVVSIKGVPACAKSSLMLERKTRGWSDVPFANVAADIVGAAGLSLMYRGPDIVFRRVEQRQESDLAFLERITKEQGMRMTIKNRQAIIYSGQRADALPPIELERESLEYGQASFKRTLDDVYTQCVVGYTEADSADTVKKDFQPGEAPATGKVLNLSKRIENPAQAERVARSELRDKNCRHMTATISGMGDTRFLAGTVLKLTGWGQFDSEYVIQQATHTISKDAGYTTSCDLVLALDY